MKTAVYSTIIYTLIVLIGGFIGYLKAQSTASLVMSTVFAIWLLVSAIGLFYNYAYGFYSALLAVISLLLFFTYRYYLTQSFMPAGLMLILSVGMIVILVFSRSYKN